MALRSRGRFGIPRLLDAIEGAAAIRGGHSWLEREYLRLVSAAGLPIPLTQQVLARAGDRLVRVDFRMNALLADGLQPYQFAYEHVVETPTQNVRVGAGGVRGQGSGVRGQGSGCRVQGGQGERWATARSATSRMILASSKSFGV